MRLWIGYTVADIRYSMALPIHDTKSGTRAVLYFNGDRACIGHGAMSDRWERDGQKVTPVDNPAKLRLADPAANYEGDWLSGPALPRGY
jgi:hypothetical protein